MCMSCGCGSPNDDHGDSRNITLNDIDQAAQAAGTTRDRVLQNMYGGGNQQNVAAGEQSPSGNVFGEGPQYSTDGQTLYNAQQQAASMQSQYNQTPIMQTGYERQEAEQQGQVLEGGDKPVPGQKVQTPGTQGGTAWGQGETDLNYQPPNRETPSH